MPSINDSLDFQRTPANAFVSPFSSAATAVLYSSITIPGADKSKGSCLACATQNLTNREIEDMLLQLIVPAPSSSIRSGLQDPPTLS